MIKQVNKKGFTLVEIVVVLLISSIVMVITGGILVNSMGFFNDNTQMTTDQAAAEGVLEYIESEVKYATDVFIGQSAPSEGDWHYLSVDDGKLSRDGQKVFNDDYYYGSRLLEISTKGYSNGYRLDVTIDYKTSSESKYKTSLTFELMNLKITKDENSSYDPFGNITSAVTISDKDGNYKIYYIKDTTKVVTPSDEPIEPSEPEDDLTNAAITGTVADIVNNIDPMNFRGVFIPNQTYNYQQGEIVWYDGSYWENMFGYNNSTPGVNFGWKRLVAEYNAPHMSAPNNYHSSYEEGDIVTYQGQYYQAQYRIDQCDTESGWQTITYSSAWKNLGSTNSSAAYAIVSQKVYDKKEVYNATFSGDTKVTFEENYIVSKYWPGTSVMSDPLKTGYDTYKSNTNYNKGDIVKVVNSTDSSYYDLYIKCESKRKKYAPGSPGNYWLKIDYTFDSGSYYAEDDIVRLAGIGANPWIIATEDITKVTTPATDIHNKQDYWKVFS